MAWESYNPIPMQQCIVLLMAGLLLLIIPCPYLQFLPEHFDKLLHLSLSLEGKGSTKPGHFSLFGDPVPSPNVALADPLPSRASVGYFPFHLYIALLHELFAR